MKKIKFFLPLILVFLSTLISCGSDDNTPSTPASIIAKWNVSKTVVKTSTNTSEIPYTSNEAGCDKDYTEFAANGSLNKVVYFKNASNVCTPDAAGGSTWNKSNNTLTITGGEFAGTYQIKTLSESQLTIESTQTLSGTQFTTTVYFNKNAN